MTPAQRKLLAVELKRLEKAGLVACLTQLAESIPDVWQHLERRLELGPRTIEDVVERARSAIARATDFDEREMNYNFDYDSAAYGQVKRCFRQIVKMGHFETAMGCLEEVISGRRVGPRRRRTGGQPVCRPKARSRAVAEARRSNCASRRRCIDPVEPCLGNSGPAGYGGTISR